MRTGNGGVSNMNFLSNMKVYLTAYADETPAVYHEIPNFHWSITEQISINNILALIYELEPVVNVISSNGANEKFNIT